MLLVLLTILKCYALHFWILLQYKSICTTRIVVGRHYITLGNSIESSNRLEEHWKRWFIFCTFPRNQTLPADVQREGRGCRRDPLCGQGCGVNSLPGGRRSVCCQAEIGRSLSEQSVTSSCPHLRAPRLHREAAARPNSVGETSGHTGVHGVLTTLRRHLVQGQSGADAVRPGGNPGWWLHPQAGHPTGGAGGRGLLQRDCGRAYVHSSADGWGYVGDFRGEKEEKKDKEQE